MTTNIRIQLISVLVGAGLLVAKFWAYWITLSNTVLTDALESIVNVVAGVLGLYSLIIAAQPKDEDHPYGHGKVEFISAGVEGTLIGIAGGLIMVKSVHTLFNPEPLSNLDWGVYITAFAGLVNYGLGAWAIRQGKRANSLALIASGKHLMSDAYSTVGLVVGLGLIMLTGWQVLDSIIAVIFGGIIAWTGYGLVRESVSGIMDEVDYPLLDEVAALLDKNRQPDWIDIHNLRIIKYGNALHVDCHLTVPRFFDVVTAHAEVDKLEALFEEAFKAPTELFIHVDACIPSSCKLCTRQNCPVRSEAFQALETWAVPNILLNRKHGIEE
jgi:cation diffusion facilitator family transporter